MAADKKKPGDVVTNALNPNPENPVSVNADNNEIPQLPKGVADEPALEFAPEDNFLNAQVLIEDRSYGSVYPLIQYTSGAKDKKREGGLAYLGGFFLSAEQNLTIPGFEPYTLITKEGEEIPGYWCRDLQCSIIGWRRSWQVDPEGGLSQRFANDEYEDAMEVGKPRGNVHLLVRVRGLSEPVVVTARGLSTKAFVGMGRDRGLVPSFATKLVNAATRLARANGKQVNYPSCAFWITIGPDREEDGTPKFTTVGTKEKANITLPIWVDEPAEVNTHVVQRAYVGPAAFSEHQKMFQDAEGWMQEWSTEALSAARARFTRKKKAAGAEGEAETGKVGGQSLPI